MKMLVNRERDLDYLSVMERKRVTMGFGLNSKERISVEGVKFDSYQLI